MTLPLRLDAQPAAVLVASRTSRADAPLAGLSIVVADDQEDSRDLIEFLLTQQGAIVTLAGTGAEAFAAVKQHPPDVLLSDIEMPDETGYALIGRVRALAAGFQRHLPKPFQPGDLFALVGDLAGRYAPARS